MNKIIYTKDHKFLIKKLKNARLENGLSQKIVSEKLCKTQSYVSKIESGQRRIDIIQLKEFARLYKKSISFFLN